jgi:hypothetical protein
MQPTGDSRENAWQPALAEIEDALVPAFIVEELDDGRFTVFVPSVPTPLAGAIYILTAARVHPVDVPFTQATKVITRWGSGPRAVLPAGKRGTETTFAGQQKDPVWPKRGYPRCCFVSLHIECRLSRITLVEYVEPIPIQRLRFVPDVVSPRCGRPSNQMRVASSALAGVLKMSQMLTRDSKLPPRQIQ